MRFAFLIPFTFVLFLTNCSTKKIDKNTLVEIQPFKGFPSYLSDSVAAAITLVYDVKTIVATEIDIPQKAFVHIKSPRYRADTLIRFLRDKDNKQNVGYILGLINEDISTTKYTDFASKTIKKPENKYKDWGIFGLGFRPGKSCIVSIFRLQKKVSKQQFISRLKKISCHEIGHNFGLPHCPNTDCIMQDAAETIKTIDQVELHLCGACKNKIGLK